MQPVEARDGREAITVFECEQPSLIVLDIGMPEMDGLEVCRELRKTSDVPILFLSSHDEEIDRVIGLEIGGDDYVTKPFSPRELVARVNVILKRLNPPQKAVVPAVSYQYGNVSLDVERHIVCWEKLPVELTATEFSIVKTLLQHPARVYNRDTIIEAAYAVNIHISDRTVDSHIRHIRQKFRDIGCLSIIETVRGIGYKLGSCE